MVFIGLYRALYDYAPQDATELAIKEGNLLCVLDKGDDDWWKAKKKAASEEEEEPEGLIPANYVEPAKPTSNAKALYEYTRQTDEEISFPEDAELEVFDTSDDDWTLVGFKGEFGFAPANYIELDEAPPPMPNRSRPSEKLPTPEAKDRPAPRRAPSPSPSSSPVRSPAAALAGVLQSKSASSNAQSRSIIAPPPAQTLPPRKKQVQFTPEESDNDEPPPSLPRRPPSEQYIEPLPPRAARQVIIKEPEPEPEAGQYGVLTSPPHNRVVSAVYDEESSLRSPGGYHLYNIYEVLEVMGRNRKVPITLGINIAKGIIMISSEGSTHSKEWSADKLTHYSVEGKHVFMELERPSKSIDFHAGAKDTASEIMTALGELAGAVKAEGLKEVFVAGAGTQKLGKILYDFKASEPDEVSVSIGDEVIVLDDEKSEDWWSVRRKDNGKEGSVPSSYVEVIGTVSSAASKSASSSSSKKSYVEQNRREEERLAREASKTKKSRSEVGPGLQLPERGSSLSQEDRRKSAQRTPSDSKTRRSQGKKTMPNTSKIRTWTDRSGSFKVEAEFIGLNDGKIHLHKSNGVKIAVPVEKMSNGDLEYVERATGKSLEDEKTLADIKRRKSGREPPSGASVEKKPDYDWFEFFLQCGVSYQICEKYAAAFRRDEIGKESMTEITPGLLRTLGLKEGDILRVMKFLDNKFGRNRDITPTSANGNAGGLFSGPGGTLHDNTKKGRPKPANPAKDTVDADAFAPKSEAAPKSPVGGEEDNKLVGGFDDDAWATRPVKSTPSAQTPTSPVAPPTIPTPVQRSQSSTVAELAGLSLSTPPLQPTPAVQPSHQETPAAPVAPQGATPSLFEQLAKSPGSMLNQQQNLAVPRQRPQAPIQTQTQNAVIAPPPLRAASAPQNPNQSSAFPLPPLQPQLTGYPTQPNMHTQPAPLGQSMLQQRAMQQQQALMAQQTGYGQPQMGFNNGMNGLMPQMTGYGQFQPQMPQFQQPQQTGYMTSPFADPINSYQPMQQQYTQNMMPQATGINSVLPPALIPQQTGANVGYNGNGYGSSHFPPVPPIPQGPTAAPLIAQKTGPPPPVRFGVNPAAKKLAPQPTGKRANLSQASAQNPFGFD